ncbi:MAG: radical SAM protein [Alphaproteobacteria bacterium]|nr:radical SAM protein [Alphaproteobacteria bacterium]
MLKYREIVHSDWVNFVASAGRNDLDRARPGLSRWQQHMRTHHTEIPETFAVHGNILISDPDTPTMDLLAETVTSGNFNNLSFYWESPDEIDPAQLILTKSEQARVLADRAASIFDLVETDIDSITELERDGLSYLGAQIPYDSVRQVNRYAKTVAPKFTLVAVSLDTDELGFCDAALEEWLPILESVKKDYPRVAFVLLEPTTRENRSPGTFARAGVLPLRGRGHGPLESLAMAKVADLFVGNMEPYGYLAAAAKLPGIYINPVSGDHHNPEHLQWFLNDASLGDPASIISDILRQMGTGKAPDGFAEPARADRSPPRPVPVPARRKIPGPADKWYVPPDKRDTVTLYVDVFGHCNLRCPSCPVGNWNQADSKAFASGLIDEETLVSVLEKATAETNVSSVGLFNWTEPLLNPRAPELIEVVKSFGLSCSISSNLNQLRDPERLLQSGLDWMRVSLSGFHQETYVKGHRGGDIEKVKQNMRRLADARDATGATTDIEVFYHKYLDNVDDEADMRAFAEDLGFRFVSAWAYLMPVEKMLTVAGDNEHGAPLSDTDRELIGRLALDPLKALDVTRKTETTDCNLYDFLTIDIRGDLYLCCASSGSPKNRLGSYLDMGIAEIREKQRSHNLCGPCMAQGLPALYGHSDPEFDEIGEQALRAYGSDTRMRVHETAPSGQ